MVSGLLPGHRRFRERLERAWATDPASTVFEHGIYVYDSEWVAERADFVARALNGYVSASDGHLSALDVSFERTIPGEEIERVLEAWCNEALEKRGSPFRFYSVHSPDQCHHVALVTPQAFAAMKARQWLRVRPLPGGRWGALIEGGTAAERILALARDAGESHLSLLDALAAYATSPDEVVREWVAEALESIEDRRAIAIARELLLDPNQHVRERARASFQREEARRALESPEAWEGIGRALADADWNRRCAAVELLGKFVGPPAIPRLVPREFDAHPAVQGAAASALRSIDRQWMKRPEAREAVPALVAQLGASAENRNRAAHMLGEIGDPRALVALIAALTEEGSSGWILDALDKIDPEWARTPEARAAAPLLLDAAVGARKSGPELVAICALSRVAGVEHADVYLRLLADSNPWVVAEAASALGRVRATVAVTPLLSLLANENYYVRKSAATALGEIGSRDAIPGLRAARKDGDFLVREAVMEALVRCEGER